jgi:prefoldin alpha subunit
MDEQDLNAKYMQYKILDEKLKELREQLQMIEQQIIEVMSTVQTIDDYSKIKDNSEVLVPLANGIFVKAILKKEDKLLLNIGSSTVVDKSLEETKDLIEKQKTDLQAMHQKMTDNIQKLLQRASALEKELNNLVSKE